MKPANLGRMYVGGLEIVKISDLNQDGSRTVVGHRWPAPPGRSPKMRANVPAEGLPYLDGQTAGDRIAITGEIVGLNEVNVCILDGHLVIPKETMDQARVTVERQLGKKEDPDGTS